MKNLLLVTCLCALVLACGKDQTLKTEVTEYVLDCNHWQNSLECHGSNIKCDYAAWGDNTLRCTVQTTRMEEE